MRNRDPGGVEASLSLPFVSQSSKD
jgi:hypothetical protein